MNKQFWEKWEKADDHERTQMLSKLEIHKIDNKTRSEIVNRLKELGISHKIMKLLESHKEYLEGKR